MTFYFWAGLMSGYFPSQRKGPRRNRQSNGRTSMTTKDEALKMALDALKLGAAMYSRKG